MVILLTVVLSSVLLCQNYSKTDIKNIIIQESINQDLNPVHALALIAIESSFNSIAIGDDGKSSGATQIQYTTAWEMGFRGDIKELLNPEINIHYGLKYFKFMKQKTKSINQAYDAYNRGYNAIYYPYKGLWKEHPYVKKILKYINDLYYKEDFFILLNEGLICLQCTD
jgi:soluble lytic murein transglycosylase-like protein